jgi:hypothetical protein
MSAPQDAWAGPLAKDLVDAWRTTDLTYIRVSTGAYDETTGTIPVTETTIAAAGAVVRTSQVERDGTQQEHELTAWIDHATVPWPVTTKDRLQYLGRKWKITEVSPSYGSGMGSSGGATLLTTKSGWVLTTRSGIPLAVKGSGGSITSFNMYASKIIARAE